MLPRVQKELVNYTIPGWNPTAKPFKISYLYGAFTIARTSRVRDRPVRVTLRFCSYRRFAFLPFTLSEDSAERKTTEVTTK